MANPQERPGPWAKGRLNTNVNVKLVISSDDWPALDEVANKTSLIRLEATKLKNSAPVSNSRCPWARQSAPSQSSDSISVCSVSDELSDMKQGQSSTEDSTWSDVSTEELGASASADESSGSEMLPLEESKNSGAKKMERFNLKVEQGGGDGVLPIPDANENAESPVSNGSENRDSSSGNENGGSSVASDDVAENHTQIGNGHAQKKKGSKMKWKPLPQDVPQLGPVRYTRLRREARERGRQREPPLPRNRPPLPAREGSEKFKGIGVTNVSGDETCPRQNQSQNQHHNRPSGRGRGRGGWGRGRGGNRGGGGRQTLQYQTRYDAPIQDPNNPTKNADIYTYYDYVQEVTALSPSFSPAPEYAMPYYGSNYYESLMEQLIFQIEYYFSEANLEKDMYMRKKMDSEGYVPIHLIASFKRVQNLTQDIELVARAILSSPKLEVDEIFVRTADNPLKWPLGGVPLPATFYSVPIYSIMFSGPSSPDLQTELNSPEFTSSTELYSSEFKYSPGFESNEQWSQYTVVTPAFPVDYGSHFPPEFVPRFPAEFVPRLPVTESPVVFESDLSAESDPDSKACTSEESKVGISADDSADCTREESKVDTSADITDESTNPTADFSAQSTNEATAGLNADTPAHPDSEHGPVTQKKSEMCAKMELKSLAQIESGSLKDVKSGPSSKLEAELLVKLKSEADTQAPEDNETKLVSQLDAKLPAEKLVESLVLESESELPADLCSEVLSQMA